MVTTEELIKMAEKESAERGKAKEEIAEAKELAMIKWKIKLAKEKKTAVGKQKFRKAVYQPTSSLGKLKAGTGGKVVKGIWKKMISEYKKGLKPVKKRKIVKRRTPVMQKIQPQFKQLPTSVRQLQNIKNVRHLLTKAEQIEIDRLATSNIRRSAAIRILRNRLKEQEMERYRANPGVIIKKDIMTGRTKIERKIPKERWLM